MKKKSYNFGYWVDQLYIADPDVGDGLEFERSTHKIHFFHKSLKIHCFKEFSVFSVEWTLYAQCHLSFSTTESSRNAHD